MTSNKSKVMRAIKGFYGVAGPPPDEAFVSNVEPMLPNKSERAFVKAAAAKGHGPVIRAGWPDFLLVTKSGQTIAVEVKGPNDSISAAQRVTFAALEHAGVEVFVWRPDRPGALTPWRTFLAERGLRK